MKKFILIFLMYTMMLLSLSVVSFAGTGKSKTVPLKKEKRQETDPPIDNMGRRTPFAPLMGVINEDGISIDNTNIKFNLYEVYDEAGSLLASYSMENEFITFIFSTDEDVEIRFYSDNFVLSGWWQLNIAE